MAQLSVQHDVRVTLDDEGVIQHARVANDVANECVADWFGQRWVETVDGFPEYRFTELVGLAHSEGVSPVVHVTQRFPSGLTVPIDYVAVPSDRGGVIAIGRDVRAVLYMESKLAAVQQSMELGYWQLRDVENRFRVLFESSSEAVAIVQADGLRVVEANPVAAAALGIAAWRLPKRGGHPVLDLVAPDDRHRVEAALLRAQELGKAPRIVVHLRHRNAPWLLRVSILDAERGEHLLLNLTPAGDVPQVARQEAVARGRSAELVDSSPDGIVVVNGRGDILSANHAFLVMVQEDVRAKVVGTPLGEWLRPPGGDAHLLLDSLQRQHVVPLYPTTLYGSHGRHAAAEVAAVRLGQSDSAVAGIYIRDVSRRIDSADNSQRFGRLLDSLNDQLGHAPLKTLVRATVGLVERHFIEAALASTDGNRTAAAKLLEVSRQSLYVKLARYGIAENDLDA